MAPISFRSSPAHEAAAENRAAGWIARRRGQRRATLQKAGVRHDYRVISDGYFKPANLDAILARLKDFHPDILLVAMGVPRQEFFIDAHITGEHCTIASGVGALFDLRTGRVQRAPQWMRKLRMEWVYRLLQEPQRLAKRYLLGNPAFLWRVAKTWLKGDHR